MKICDQRNASLVEQKELNHSLVAHELSNKTHGASISHLWSLNLYYGYSNLPHQGEDIRRDGLGRQRKAGDPDPESLSRVRPQWDQRQSAHIKHCLWISQPQEANNIHCASPSKLTGQIHTPYSNGFSSLSRCFMSRFESFQIKAGVWPSLWKKLYFGFGVSDLRQTKVL